ncbi:MAG: tetratricopeptide repeat protein, partial [Prevotella sp.]|nr:tetratricopeptide repeat protein [Prevotella sp.]
PHPSPLTSHLSLLTTHLSPLTSHHSLLKYMSFFKKLFGGESKPQTTEEPIKEEVSFDTLKYDGIRALRNGQLDFAEQCFLQALEREEDLEIHDHLSQLYLMRDRLDEALDEVRIMAEAQPDNMRVFLRMAHVAFMKEDYETLREACDVVLSQDEKDVEALLLLGRGALAKEQWEEAVAWLSKGIDAEPRFVDGYLFRGDAFLHLGQVDDARADADQLLTMIPDNEDALLLMARVEKASGNYDAALEYYGQVIDANPFNVAAYAERGELRSIMGDMLGSVDDIEMAKSLRPESTIGDDNAQQGIEHKVEDAMRKASPFGL